MSTPSIRTIQIWAQGFGTEPASIEATVNESVIFSGPIATVDEPVQTQGGVQFKGTGQLAFSFDIPFDFVGTIPVSIEVTGQSVVVTNSFYNYVPRFTEGEIAAGASADLFLPITTEDAVDPKSNPKINNVLQIPNRVLPDIGEWYWVLEPADVLTFDLEILTPGSVTLPVSN
jgi:hypothetical protein